MDYQKPYTILVDSAAKTIDELNKSQFVSQEMENAVRILKHGLEEAEEMYLNTDE